METFLYTIIFIIGTFFGSFFTLAVYRLPKKEDILIKHSYCPNCNHKLGFFDLFPVLSYLVLGGKCRYCKNKIRPRYLILEIFSGLTFLILSISVKFNFQDVNSIISLGFLLIYISILFIIAGIDKENKKIQSNVLIFGFIIHLIYIIYQYILKNINIYQYVIYLILFFAIMYILKITLKNDKKYIMQLVLLSLYIILYSNVLNYIFTLLLTLILYVIYKAFSKDKHILASIGFYMCVSNIVVIAISNIILNYYI